MDLFHVIEEGQVVTRQKGIFRQVKVYRRGADVFAACGNGFVKLLGMRNTTNPNVTWIEIDAPGVKLERGQPVWSEAK